MKLAKLYIGPEKLGYLMSKTTQNDSIYPILTDPHFPALDRRVMKILKEIAICVREADDIDDVIVDDSYLEVML